MNKVKVQQELIKDCLNDKGMDWFIQRVDTYIILSSKHQNFIFDECDFLISYEKLLKAGVKEITSLKKFVDSAHDAKPLVKTGNLRNAGDKRTLMELKREDNGELIYVDSTLLKYYDKKAEFDGIDAKSPLYVYEDEILVGVVLPVKVR